MLVVVNTTAHASTGPTNVDQRVSLGSLADRSSADVRGVQASVHKVRENQTEERGEGRGGDINSKASFKIPSGSKVPYLPKKMRVGSEVKTPFESINTIIVSAGVLEPPRSHQAPYEGSCQAGFTPFLIQQQHTVVQTVSADHFGGKGISVSSFTSSG